MKFQDNIHNEKQRISPSFSQSVFNKHVKAGS